MEKKDRLITVAIHTYAKALILKTMLENEGVQVVINNVNLIQPVVSSGVRVRIHERDLPLALKVIERMSVEEAAVVEENNKPRVLIPVDFSDYSRKACLIGFDFAKNLGCSVILLHSYVAMTYGAAMMPFADEDSDNRHAESKAHKRMDDFERIVKEDMAKGLLPSVKFKCIVEEGVPEVSILDCVKRENVVLVVMGTRGKSKKEAELIGSVTAEVLDAGRCPVFTVPEGMEFTKSSKIKNVVFFSNFNQQDLISFDEFARLFSDFKFNVSIIPIDGVKGDENVKQYLSNLVKYCEEHYPDFDFSAKVISDTHFVDDFDTYVKNENIDLILIPNKKRNIFARLFSPSIAHRMVFHTDTPMLVVPI